WGHCDGPWRALLPAFPTPYAPARHDCVSSTASLRWGGEGSGVALGSSTAALRWGGMPSGVPLGSSTALLFVAKGPPTGHASTCAPCRRFEAPHLRRRCAQRKRRGPLTDELKSCRGGQGSRPFPTKRPSEGIRHR